MNFTTLKNATVCQVLSKYCILYADTLRQFTIVHCAQSKLLTE